MPIPSTKQYITENNFVAPGVRIPLGEIRSVRVHTTTLGKVLSGLAVLLLITGLVGMGRALLEDDRFWTFMIGGLAWGRPRISAHAAREGSPYPIARADGHEHRRSRPARIKGSGDGEGDRRRNREGA